MKSSPIKIVVVITLIIIALIVALTLLNNNSSGSKEEATFNKQPSIEGQPTFGEADAPVTVVEFGDFKCPSCKVWGESIFPQLVKDYVETGDVQFAFINVLFHGEESELGSLAAESVYKQNPDAYWDFHESLFAEQPEENHDIEWITDEKILKIANTVHDIDTDKLKSDIEDKVAMDEINKDTELVTEFDVPFTPTIMVNETMIKDPFDYEAIKNAIDNALEGK